MSYLSPPTLTAAEQTRILKATASHPRDHTVISVALGTGLRLAEMRLMGAVAMSSSFITGSGCVSECAFTSRTGRRVPQVRQASLRDEFVAPHLRHLAIS